MSIIYLNTKAFCKLTPVFELTFCVNPEIGNPVQSIEIDRTKQYAISAYNESTGQLLDYIGKIVRVNIRYNPNNALIPLDATENDIQIMSILLDCSENYNSKRVVINVCDIRSITEYEEEDDADADLGIQTFEAIDDDVVEEPREYTVYAGLLPTFWNADRDGAFDLTTDDVTATMIKTLRTYQRTNKATNIASISIDNNLAQWAYAYPKKWEALTYINAGGFNYIGNFIRKELEINGIMYYVYFNSTSTNISITYDIG